MKKFLTIWFSLFLSIFIFFSLLDFQSEYAAEKALWKINREMGKILAQKETATTYELNNLKKKYQIFARKFSYSQQSAFSQIMLSNVLIFEKKFDLARIELKKALALAQKNKEVLARIHAALAKSYEIQNQWPKALAEYNYIIQNYPLTDLGFFTPIYIAQYYQVSAQLANARIAYDQAYNFYAAIARTKSKSTYEFNALKMMAQCRLAQEDWQAAVEQMSIWIRRYPTRSAIQESISTINAICITKLHNYDIAIRVYLDFIKTYPKHGAVDLMKKMIENLNLLKKKNVVLNTKR